VRIFRMTTGSSMVATGGRATTPPRASAGWRHGAVGVPEFTVCSLLPLVPVLVPVEGRSGGNSVERERSRNLTQVRWRPRVSEDPCGDHSSPSNRLRTCRSPVRVGAGAFNSPCGSGTSRSPPTLASLHELAAAYAVYIIQGHAFADGTQRTRAGAMLTFLEGNGGGVVFRTPRSRR
jgi:hypothetical protein